MNGLVQLASVSTTVPAGCSSWQVAVAPLSVLKLQVGVGSLNGVVGDESIVGATGTTCTAAEMTRVTLVAVATRSR